MTEPMGDQIAALQAARAETEAILARVEAVQVAASRRDAELRAVWATRMAFLDDGATPRLTVLRGGLDA